MQLFYRDCSSILHGGSKDPSPAQESGFLKAFLTFSIILAASLDLIVSRIGPNWSTSYSNGTIGPISDTLKSIAAGTGIEMLNVNRIPELETVPCSHHVKPVNCPCKLNSFKQ